MKPSMPVIVRALIEAVGYLEIAKFDGADDAQGAEDLAAWCFVEASRERRESLWEVAVENAKHLRVTNPPQEAVEWYERFVMKHSMPVIVRSLIEAVRHLELARFDDPDESQGRDELVALCVLESSPQERQALIRTAAEKAVQARETGAPQGVIDWYERFVVRVQDQTAWEDEQGIFT